MIGQERRAGASDEALQPLQVLAAQRIGPTRSTSIRRPPKCLRRDLSSNSSRRAGIDVTSGRTDPLSREHLKGLKRLVRRTSTPFLSDHLCWGSVDGSYTHDLLPMPYTWAAVKNTAERIRVGAGLCRTSRSSSRMSQLRRVSLVGNEASGISETRSRGRPTAASCSINNIYVRARITASIRSIT